MNLDSKMGIARLRRELPDWSWRMTSRGFAGFVYEGTKDERMVEVRAYGVLCGPSEDDIATQWRVIEGKQSESYICFYTRELNNGN